MLAAKSNSIVRPLTAKGFQMNLNAEATDTHLDAFFRCIFSRRTPPEIPGKEHPYLRW